MIGMIDSLGSSAIGRSLVASVTTPQRGPVAVKSGQDPGAFDGSESQPLNGGSAPENTLFILIGIAVLARWRVGPVAAAYPTNAASSGMFGAGPLW